MRNTAGLSNTGPGAQGVISNSSCDRQLLKGAGYSIHPAHRQRELCQGPMQNTQGQQRGGKTNKDSRPISVALEP
jgi:hypothetical protein